MLDNLLGDWSVKSFVANDKTEDASKIYFKFTLTDVGDYTLSEIFIINPRNVVSTAMIFDEGGNKFKHEYISGTSDKPEYAFGLTGTFTYSLNGDVLTLTGGNKKVVLQRK